MMRLVVLELLETGVTIMFKTVRQWIFWWKRSRKLKLFLQQEAWNAKMRGPKEPPTPEEVEKFKKEWDLGWDSHMVQRVEPRRTYFEANLN